MLPSPARRSARAARAPRRRSSCDFSGSTFVGKPPLPPQVVPDVLVGWQRTSAVDAERAGERIDEAASRPRRRGRGRSSRRRSGGRRARSARRRGATSSRAPSAATIRPDTTCPARSAAGRPARTAPSAAGAAHRPARASRGPSAAVFHSAPSMSSIDTNVGSPPIVSLTSRALSASSTRRPSASIACHCSSVYGLVTRGDS